jgi:Flp pilus assembly pilin Flp
MKGKSCMNNVKNTQGQGLTEYLMLVLLIAVISIGIVKSIGTQVQMKLKLARDNIQRDITLGR